MNNCIQNMEKYRRFYPKWAILRKTATGELFELESISVDGFHVRQLGTISGIGLLALITFEQFEAGEYKVDIIKSIQLHPDIDFQKNLTMEERQKFIRENMKIARESWVDAEKSKFKAIIGLCENIDKTEELLDFFLME